MNASFRIRRARPADADAIHAVARASWHAAYGDLLDADAIDATIDEWYGVADLRESIDADRHAMAVAERTETVDGDSTTEATGGSTGATNNDAPGLVGFAHATDNADAGRAELRRLYVREPFWDDGVGTALLTHVARPMRAAGHDAISAVVLADNEIGLGFYRARGFAVVDEQTSTFGGETVAEVIVEAPLEQILDEESDLPHGTSQ